MNATPLELQAMTHIIRSLHVSSILMRYESSENFRRIFDAWCEKYEI